ncbi:hypothetical protein QR680_009116 [Steinernema hermaphroditum]|uniref:Uncharacterized protein n=1 Tax=Steinernema hermaphroditum TaxID=289476 RepID=A0AA39IJ41_9BILA|nr:hypothetical protein QR680_009116 [Steinernema hermaphroditum]
MTFVCDGASPVSSIRTLLEDSPSRFRSSVATRQRLKGQCSPRAPPKKTPVAGSELRRRRRGVAKKALAAHFLFGTADIARRRRP